MSHNIEKKLARRIDLLTTTFGHKPKKLYVTPAEIAELMDAGRNALYKQGRSEEGPYQSPMEDGMQHFHEFLHRELGPHLPV